MSKKQFSCLFYDFSNPRNEVLVRGFEIGSTNEVNNLYQEIFHNYVQENEAYANLKKHEQGILAFFRNNEKFNRLQLLDLASEQGFNMQFSDELGPRALIDSITETTMLLLQVYDPALGIQVEVTPTNVILDVYRSAHTDDNFVKVGETEIGTGIYLDTDVHIGATYHYKVRTNGVFKTPFTDVQSIEVVEEE